MLVLYLRINYEICSKFDIFKTIIFELRIYSLENVGKVSFVEMKVYPGNTWTSTAKWSPSSTGTPAGSASQESSTRSQRSSSTWLGFLLAAR